MCKGNQALINGAQNRLSYGGNWLPMKNQSERIFISHLPDDAVAVDAMAIVIKASSIEREFSSILRLRYGTSTVPRSSSRDYS